MSQVKQGRKRRQANSKSGLDRYSFGLSAPMTLPNQVGTVEPVPGETQSQFFDRANGVLAQQYPETNQRTPAILRLWQQSQNDKDLREKAQRRFTSDKFKHSGPRCVFLSHTIPPIAEERDEKGSLVRMGREGTEYHRENLQKLVDYANYRIRNADQFAALSEGHMPTLEEKKSGRPDADVLGYAGPFYLGLFGDVKPQWSIWCDEWIHVEDLPRAQKLQRRSPEVWCKEPIERRTMDPIAMLGSETPRLDSGMDLYSLRADGQTIMRYSMGMAMPGPDNTYVPGSENGTQNYGATDMPFPPKQPPQAPQGQQQAAPTPQPDGTPPVHIEEIVQSVLAGLMPSIVQAVMDHVTAEDPNSNDAVPQEGQDDPSDDDIPRGIDNPADADDAVGDEAASPSPTNQSPDSPSPQSNTGQQPPKPSQTTPDQAGMQQPTAQSPDPMMARQPGNQPAQYAPNTAPPQAVMNPQGQQGMNSNQPSMGMPQQQAIDDQHQQYMAMSPECGQAYAAGHAACQTKMKGQPMVTENYAKQFEDQAALIKQRDERIDAMMKRIAFLEQDKQDTERYAKVHSILSGKELPADKTEREILAETFEMAEPEFDRYCKLMEMLPQKADAIETQIYDDPTFEPGREHYSRRSGGTAHSKEQIETYSRQAADAAVRINAKKPGTTTYQEQWEIIAKAHGLPV